MPQQRQPDALFAYRHLTRSGDIIEWPHNGHAPSYGHPSHPHVSRIWFPGQILAYAEDRKTKKMGLLAEKELVESYCKGAIDVSPHYSNACRPIDQFVFVAPLFRLSEIQTLLLHAEILRAPGPQ